MLDTIKQWISPSEDAKKKVRVIPLSDFHTGGTTALFPFYNGDDIGFQPHRKMTGENGGWQFKHRTFMPSAKQIEMFRHFTKCAEQIKASRTDERFVVVQAGDAIDGKHHDSQQLVTGNIGEQVDVHIWLMEYFLHKIGFDKNKGDLLFYGQGTEAHDSDEEDRISRDLGAEQLPNGDDVFDFLPMDINGARFWFLHQGASAGKGVQSGQALYNWMKNQYFACLEDARTIPSVCISGHFHSSVYTTYTRKDRTIHGIILPPFQLKTRFGFRVASAELDGVGIRTVDVGSNGEIKVNPAMLLRGKDEVVTI